MDSKITIRSEAFSVLPERPMNRSLFGRKSHSDYFSIEVTTGLTRDPHCTTGCGRVPLHVTKYDPVVPRHMPS